MHFVVERRKPFFSVGDPFQELPSSQERRVGEGEVPETEGGESSRDGEKRVDACPEGEGGGEEGQRPLGFSQVEAILPGAIDDGW
jgi:hypothetical protein